MTITPTGTYSDLFFGSDDHDEHSYVLTPNNDPSPARYFWSCIIGWTNPLGGYIGGGYFGMQTFGTSIPGDKCVVFSIGDGALDAEVYDLSGIAANDFDGGLGWSTRIPYTWEPGVDYRLRVFKGDTDVDGQWWEAEVTNLDTSTTTAISRIKVDPTWLGINGYSILFTERYAGAVDTCDDVEYVSADFTELLADGTISPINIESKYATIGTCPNADVATITGGVRHRMGMASDAIVTIDTTYVTVPDDPTAGGLFTVRHSFTPTVNFDSLTPDDFYQRLTVEIPADLLAGGGTVNTDATYRVRSIVDGTPGVWTAPVYIGTTRVASRTVSADWPTTTVWEIEVTFIATTTEGNYTLQADAYWTDAVG